MLDNVQNMLLDRPDDDRKLTFVLLHYFAHHTIPLENARICMDGEPVFWSSKRWQKTYLHTLTLDHHTIHLENARLCAEPVFRSSKRWQKTYFCTLTLFRSSYYPFRKCENMYGCRTCFSIVQEMTENLPAYSYTNSIMTLFTWNMRDYVRIGTC